MTNGQVRSSSTDDIAARSHQTDYDGCFVRHGYFAGADDPMGASARPSTADISVETSSAVNPAASRPFPCFRSGNAIKVINH